MLFALRYCGGYLLLLLSCAWDLFVHLIFPDKHVEGRIPWKSSLTKNTKLTGYLSASADNSMQTGWTSFLGMVNDLVLSCTSSAAMSPAVDIVAKVVRVYSRHILQLPKGIHTPAAALSNRARGSLDDEDAWGFHVDHDTEIKRLPLLESQLEDFEDESCESAAVSLDLLRQWEQRDMLASPEYGRNDLLHENLSDSKTVY